MWLYKKRNKNSRFMCGYVPVFVFLWTPGPCLLFWSCAAYYHTTLALAGRTGSLLPSNVCVCYNSYKQHFRSDTRYTEMEKWRISRKYISISLLLHSPSLGAGWWVIYQDDAWSTHYCCSAALAIIYIAGNCQSVLMNRIHSISILYWLHLH